MFDKSQEVPARSPRSLILSVTIHAAFVAVLLMARFAVKTEIAPRWNRRVELVAPVAPPPMKRAAVRMPSKPPEVHAAARLPLPLTPAPAPVPVAIHLARSRPQRQ